LEKILQFADNGLHGRSRASTSSIRRPVLLADAERPLAIGNWIAAAALILGRGRWYMAIKSVPNRYVRLPCRSFSQKREFAFFSVFASYASIAPLRG
jgi:type IV secretory pathway TrbD component